MKYNVARLQEFFLEMAAETYASGEKAARTPGRSWERTFERSRGELTYIDRFIVNGEYSGGETRIIEADAPVWMMHYGGKCKNDDSELLAFLKDVLSGAYRRGKFYGGRGIDQVATQIRGSRHWYGNQYEGGFQKCAGYEYIATVENADIKKVFWHKYHCLLLGDPE